MTECNSRYETNPPKSAPATPKSSASRRVPSLRFNAPPFQARWQFLVQSLARQRTAIALTPPRNQPLVRPFKTAIVGDRKCVKIAADRLPTCVGSSFRFRPFKESIRSSATKQAWESFEVFRIVMAAFKCWCRCLHIAFPILAHQPIPLNPNRSVVVVPILQKIHDAINHGNRPETKGGHNDPTDKAKFRPIIICQFRLLALSASPLQAFADCSFYSTAVYAPPAIPARLAREQQPEHNSSMNQTRDVDAQVNLGRHKRSCGVCALGLFDRCDN